MTELQSPIDEWHSGAVVGDFEIVEQIGSGGLSRVYRARQRPLDREVALKVTEQRPADTRATAEGRVMAALRHDNIVGVYSEVVTDASRILAMQLVDGPSLAEVITALHAKPNGVSPHSDEDCRELVRQLAGQRNAGQLRECDFKAESGAAADNRAWPSTADARGRMARTVGRLLKPGWLLKPADGDVTTFACGLVRQLALALQHTHGQGVYHCDVKPANVLLTRDARPLLTDFNVSARVEQTARGGARLQSLIGDTQPGNSTDSPVGGTLLYMAPEQLAAICGLGSAAVIDGRADVYSLGLVLFELLTGCWPFPEAGIDRDPLLAPRQLYAARLSTSVEFPRQGGRLPRALQRVIEHCLKADPAERYQSASELADDLQCALERRPLRWAERPTLSRRAGCFVNRHRTAAMLTSLMGVMLVIAMLMSVLPFSFAEFSDDRAELQDAGVLPRVADLQLQHRAQRRMAERFELAGREALAANQFEQAVAELQQAVALTPQHAAAQHNLGIALFRTGRFAEAIDAFDAALELGARSGRVFSYRAAARLALGDVAGAEEDFVLARRFATETERHEVEANYQTFVARLDQRD